MIEPEPGSTAVGYVSARSSQDSINLHLQRRPIAEFAESKGSELARLYEEPEEYENPERCPVFAQLLNGASWRFQGVLRAANMFPSWYVGSAYTSLDCLQQLGVWWASADERWDINAVWQEDIDVVCVLQCAHTVNRDLHKSRNWRREGN